MNFMKNLELVKAHKPSIEWITSCLTQNLVALLNMIERRLMNCLKSIIMIFRSKYESDTQAILKGFY